MKKGRNDTKKISNKEKTGLYNSFITPAKFRLAKRQARKKKSI